MQTPWLDTLKTLAQQKPLVVIRFEKHEWERLSESRRGPYEFTIARSHSLLAGIGVPTPCLIVGADRPSYPSKMKVESRHLHFGLVSSRSPISTLESRIKIRRSLIIRPNSEAELLQLVTEQPHARNLKARLGSDERIVQLSPKLSSYLIDRLASIDENQGVMRAVAESLSGQRTFHGAAALQQDAVRSALKAFGLTSDDQALSLELVKGRDTALTRIGIMEDSVVEHDARHLPGYDLVDSDLTGRAVFERGNERLEVFTANRRPLEHVFGVDLIYLNITRQNIVMVQYKMLEPERDGTDTDWIYRPDTKLDSEIRRMRKFARNHSPGPFEYRLNPEVFYLKFVKRDGAISNGAIVTPIDHFEKLRKDPACRGSKGGLRVSYEGLAGRYLRQGAFLDLIRSGYIGAHAEKTAEMKTLVDVVLKNNRAIVAAIQSQTTTSPAVRAKDLDEVVLDDES